MKTIPLLFALALSLAVSAAEENPVVPFLAVTGRPTEADLVRKVTELKAEGFDAFLIYARSGLQEKYLGERWFAIADTLCREADRQGMKVWLYDEYNWPSGTCRGRVPNEDDRFRYAEWAVYREKAGSYRWQKILAPRGWVNVLDEGAMARFIELTHREYEKRLAKWFAKGLIKGIFTDEPGHPTAMSFEGNPVRRFPCWDGLEAAYAARTGRDFRRDVEAFLDRKGSAAVWETFAQLQGERFRTNYFDRIEEWCRKMGIVSTGHMIAEDSLTGSCRYNGNPLVALKGESLPGMDEIGSRTADAEWLTLAVAQHAATRKGKGGLVELYALGPNDMTAARLRQMIWLEALHGVDCYLTSMQIMDHRGLVEKHGYLSPVQEGQPWHREMRLLIDEAKTAAAFARRLDYAKAVAVRYPQKAAARAVYAGEKAPPLRQLLGEINRSQLTFDLIEEDEQTDLSCVFAFDGETCRETKTGTAFPTTRAAVDWLVARTKQTVRYYERDGSLATNLLVRTYADGSSVALDVRDAGVRRLFAEIGGVRKPCVLPSRGVLVLRGGAFPPEPEDAAQKGYAVPARDFAYRLDRPNVIRLGFDTNNVARFTVTEPLTDVRLVLRELTLTYAVTGSGRPVDAFEAAPPGEKVFRHDAVPYVFELDDKPIRGACPAQVLPVEFNSLYRETEPLSLAAGPHVLRLVTGEADRNFFLPAAFVSGTIARRGDGIGRLPARLGFGSLAEQGLGDFCGAVTYHLENVAPKSRTLRLSTGGGFTRVRWQGADLGVRAWEPFEWQLPSAEPGTLDVTVYTSVVRIFGDVNRPGADWDTNFWIKPNDPEHRDGLYER